jgi:hypothetical protein
MAQKNFEKDNPFMKFLLFLALGMFGYGAAFADVIGYGAAARCDKSGFELGAVTQHNEEFSLVVTDMHGLKVLPTGLHDLQCHVGKKKVEINVRVFDGGNGMCMGAGYVEIENFKVGPTQLPDKGPFNWNCPSSPGMLVKLRVYAVDDQLRLERCSADEWSWESGYRNLKCEHSEIEDIKKR